MLYVKEPIYYRLLEIDYHVHDGTSVFQKKKKESEFSLP